MTAPHVSTHRPANEVAKDRKPSRATLLKRIAKLGKRSGKRAGRGA